MTPPPASCQQPLDPWAGDRLDRTAELSEIRARIAALADADNLAAVIVHLNDTYLIEERPPWIPGLARIAGVIDDIRALVRQRLGDDRTLVCHGGDYLGPSRLGKEFKGAAMVELLRHCGLNVATLGNHEFDYDRASAWDTLRTRLRESQGPHGPGLAFRTVLSNVRPAEAPDRSLFDRFMPWPPAPAAPLFAVCGYAGGQTLKVACAHSFSRVSTDQMLDELHESLLAAPSVLAIVMLTHASRDEDRELQCRLRDKFRNHAIYVLGGHDHHVQWAERMQQAVLLKCLSNGRSLGVIAVPKDGLAAVRIGNPGVPREELSYEDKLQILSGGRDRYLSGPLLAQPDLVVRNTMARLRSRGDKDLAGRLGGDFLHAFEQRIGRTLDDCSKGLRDSFASDLCSDLVSLAVDAARHSLHAVAVTFDCSQAAQALPVHAAAQEATERWLALSQDPRDGDEIVVNFQSFACGLDALDSSIRARSTDFGNFVADAMRQATGAALALMNSGSLRADAILPARLTRKHLRDALLYDAEAAGAVVSMRADEIRRALAHAKTKGDHGAFLQVSAGCDAALECAGEGLLRVALVRHMIVAPHDEDGYCAALAIEGEPWEQAQARLLGRVQTTGSLEAWICAGAAHVAYSNEIRLASDTPMAQVAVDIKELKELIGLVDRYRQACREADLRPENHLVTIGDEKRCPQELRHAIDALVAFVERGYLHGPGSRDVWFTEMYKRAMSDEANYTGALLARECHPIGYAKYLDLIVEVICLRRNLKQPMLFRWLG